MSTTVVVRVVLDEVGRKAFRSGRAISYELLAQDYIGHKLEITRNGEVINESTRIAWGGSGLKNIGCAFIFGLIQQHGLWFSSAVRSLTPFNFRPGEDELRFRLKVEA